MMHTQSEPQFPLPELSEDLQTFVDEFPYELYVKMNGMAIEQRIYCMTRVLLETEPSPFDICTRMLMLSQAEDLLLAWGAHIFRHNEAHRTVMQSLHLPGIRDKLLDMLMHFTPDWEAIINKLAGDRFCMGNNRWLIIGFYADPKDEAGDRHRVRVLCSSIEPEPGDVFESDAPKFELNQRTAFGIQQVESGLGRRLI